MIEFEIPKVDDPISASDARIIKVIGVGGGGGNAVAHMYNEGMRDVRFEVCNTDRIALIDSPVPVRRQLGEEGLGAGSNPAKGREIAEKSLDEISKMFDDGTRMVFITAGMGGGTGTGAAPVIAREAKKAGVLTVGVVTIPFLFEREKRIDQALDGVEELSRNVDSLLVINNERLRKICAINTMIDAFKRADDTLLVAVKSIVDIITTSMKINPDFNDVKTVLSDGGIALISYGEAEGPDRVSKAIEEATTSPLLSDHDIFNARRILMTICSSDDKNTLTIPEIDVVNNFMEKFVNENIQTKFGFAPVPGMGGKVKITILASGFGKNSLPFASANSKDSDNEAADSSMSIDEINRRQARKAYYYGDKNERKNGMKRKQRHHVFHFGEDDIDNPWIIETIAASATYNRTSETLRKIKEQHEVK